MEPKRSPVTNQNEAEVLLDFARGFHDAVATAAKWEGAEFVNQKGWMELHGYGNLYIQISSQFEDVPDLELEFMNVSYFSYDYNCDIEASITIEPETVSANFLTWRIRAQRLSYRANRLSDNL